MQKFGWVNMGDAARKGRLNKKYTREQVIYVVKLYESGETIVNAAAMVGMSEMMAGKIICGENWNYLTGIPKRSGKRNKGD